MSDKPEEMIAPRKSHYPNKKYLDYISRRNAPSEARKNIYNLAHLKPASNLDLVEYDSPLDETEWIQAWICTQNTTGMEISIQGGEKDSTSLLELIKSGHQQCDPLLIDISGDAETTSSQAQKLYYDNIDTSWGLGFVKKDATLSSLPISPTPMSPTSFSPTLNLSSPVFYTDPFDVPGYGDEHENIVTDNNVELVVCNDNEGMVLNTTKEAVCNTTAEIVCGTKNSMIDDSSDTDKNTTKKRNIIKYTHSEITDIVNRAGVNNSQFGILAGRLLSVYAHTRRENDNPEDKIIIYQPMRQPKNPIDKNETGFLDGAPRRSANPVRNPELHCLMCRARDINQ